MLFIDEIFMIEIMSEILIIFVERIIKLIMVLLIMIEKLIMDEMIILIEEIDLLIIKL